jgi:precorrin-8X/cobalt-precorrin-8 methylmutase
MNEALLVIGHGSRDREGVREFLQLGRMLRQRRQGRATAVAFLEFERPTIEAGIEQLVAAGADRIVCQPGMLFAAGHVKRDVPRAVRAAMRRWRAVEFRIGRALDDHPKLFELCSIRWQEALAARPFCPREQTMLLLAGRGSNDSDANTRLAAIAGRLAETYGVACGAECYSGLAAPLVPDALEAATRRGFRRIVVQPYFICRGVLVQQIHAWTNQCAEQFAGLEIFSTEHLGAHALLADVFEDRAAEAADRVQPQHVARQTISRRRRTG